MTLLAPDRVLLTAELPPEAPCEDIGSTPGPLVGAPVLGVLTFEVDLELTRRAGALEPGSPPGSCGAGFPPGRPDGAVCVLLPAPDVVAPEGAV